MLLVVALEDMGLMPPQGTDCRVGDRQALIEVLRGVGQAVGGTPWHWNGSHTAA
jgi:hypothetical protein